MKTKFKSLVTSHWSLVTIIILAAVLRVWQLGSIPPGLTPDEASLGYNAYSILKTGRDEYGQLLPVIFKSFGDYKPGLYVYTAVPFVAFLGLNEWSVRLPSAIGGVLSVYLIYLVVNELFGYGLRVAPSQKIGHWSLVIGHFAAFAAAINPWLIYFSRGAWEANLSLTLTLAGIYYFLKSLYDSRFLVLASIFFSSTLLTYQGAKLSTTIVVLILLLVFWKEVRNLIKNSYLTVIWSTVVGLVITLPIVFSLFYGQTGRLAVFSVFSYPRPTEYLQEFLNQGGEKIGDLNYYLFHSEKLNFTRGILGRWFNHFSGSFLFFEGDYQNPRHSAPNSGMMLLMDLVLLPLGIIFLVRSNILNPKSKILIITWLILSPLPAVLSRDQVQSVRALNMSIPLVLLSGLGLYYLLLIVNKLKFRLPCYMLLITCYFVSFAYFLDSYFVHLPVHNAKYWQYGFKEVVQKVTPIQNSYSKIIFQQSYAQPYIYFLFHQKYDPRKYQANTSFKSGGSDVGLVQSLDTIAFESFSWPPPVDSRKTLIVGDPVAIPPDYPKSDFNLISEVKYPDGVSSAFRILETK